MDQLHEELKEVTPPPPDLLLSSKQNSSSASLSSIYLQSNSTTTTATTAGNYLSMGSTDDDRSGCSTPSQSEAEYETCDSGVSEQSSLSDEVTSVHRSIPNTINSAKIQSNQMQMQSMANSSNYSRSPSPTASQRTFKSTHSSIKSNRSNSISSLNSLQLNSQQQTQQDQEQCEKNESTSSKLPHRSIISDVFDGKLLSSVQCLTCDRVSTREETFQDLSLPIPGKDHLNVIHQTQGLVSPLPPGLTPDAVSRIFLSSPVLNNNHDNQFLPFIRNRFIKMAGFGGFGIGFVRFSGDQLSHYTIACQHSSVRTN